MQTDFNVNQTTTVADESKRERCHYYIIEWCSIEVYQEVFFYYRKPTRRVRTKESSTKAWKGGGQALEKGVQLEITELVIRLLKQWKM